MKRKKNKTLKTMYWRLWCAAPQERAYTSAILSAATDSPVGRTVKEAFLPKVLLSSLRYLTSNNQSMLWYEGLVPHPDSEQLWRAISVSEVTWTCHSPTSPFTCPHKQVFWTAVPQSQLSGKTDVQHSLIH